MSEIAKWKTARLDELCDINPPKPKLQSVDDETEVLFVPMAAVDEGSGMVAHAEQSTVGAVGHKSYRSFTSGDVLFAKITPCMENGKAAVVPKISTGFGFGSTEFHVLRPKAGTDARLIWHLVRQRSFRDEAASHFTGTVGQLRVPAEFLKSFEVVVPADITEQAQLADVLDTATTRIFDSSAHLITAQRAIERFRQAVLAAACSGRLTEEWRSVQDARLDAESLVMESRARRAAVVKNNPHNSVHDQFIDEMPESWAHVSLDALTTRITSGSRDWSKYYGSGSGTFVMAQNVRPGTMDWSFRQAVDPPRNDASRERSQILRGDLLVTIVGANTGDVAPVVEDRPEHFVCQSVALVRPAISECSAYLNLWLNSPMHGQRYFAECMYGEGRPHLSFDQLRGAPVALPPLDEQIEIVQRVDQLLHIADNLRSRIKKASMRVGRSSQAVLAKAFRGELIASGDGGTR